MAVREFSGQRLELARWATTVGGDSEAQPQAAASRATSRQRRAQVMDGSVPHPGPLFQGKTQPNDSGGTEWTDADLAVRCALVRTHCPVR
jgi:hypothetical protein